VELFKTDNIGLATCLMVTGQEFVGTEGDPYQLDFVFVNDKHIPEIKAGFLNGTLELPVLAVLNCYREVKGIVARKRRARQR